jgi:hypothetical protein
MANAMSRECSLIVGARNAYVGLGGVLIYLGVDLARACGLAAEERRARGSCGP